MPEYLRQTIKYTTVYLLTTDWEYKYTYTSIITLCYNTQNHVTGNYK